MQQMVFSFDREAANEYLEALFRFDIKRREITEVAREARNEYKDRGVPVKAIQAAYACAKRRMKQSDLIEEEWQALMTMAMDTLGTIFGDEDVPGRRDILRATTPVCPSRTRQAQARVCEMGRRRADVGRAGPGGICCHGSNL